MNLFELVNNIHNIEDEQYILVHSNEIITAESEIILLPFEGEGEKFQTPLGWEYFLEAYIAKEVLDAWIYHNNKTPTLLEKIQAIIYYAENDAYLPPKI